jgi:hypothetical protein
MGKLLLLSIISSLFILPATAQSVKERNIAPQRIPSRMWEFGLGYNRLQPAGGFSSFSDMKGASLYAGTRFLKQRLALGFTGGFSAQPFQSETKEWQINGRSTRTYVVQDSRLVHAALKARYYVRDGYGWSVFLTGSSGLIKATSDVTAFDTGDDCKVLDGKRLNVSNSHYNTAGAGISLTTGWFKKADRPKNFTNTRLDITAQYMRSGQLSIMNNRNRLAANEEIGKAVNMQFLDARTNTTHTHTVARVQQAVLQGLFINVNLQIGLSGNNQFE